MEQVDAAYLELTTALNDYNTACKQNKMDVNSAVPFAADNLLQKAMCLNTEEYFVRQIEQNPKNCTNKLDNQTAENIRQVPVLRHS